MTKLGKAREIAKEIADEQAKKGKNGTLEVAEPKKLRLNLRKKVSRAKINKEAKYVRK
jgi:hypothetical protein